MNQVYVVVEREYAAGGTGEWVDHAFSNRDAAERCKATWERGTNCEAEVVELDVEDDWHE